MNGTVDIEEDDWRRALLSKDMTIRDVVENLDGTGFQIALVVNHNQFLFGTVTDGDIRRGLLRGLDLSAPVSEVVNQDPLVVTPELGCDSVLHFMNANKIHQLPVIDEDRKVVGLHLLDELIYPRKRPNLMVIMAGGLGTRLRPHTENCPKPLLPVAGKPMLEHIIERAKDDGLSHFVLAIHYLGYMIEEYFGNGSRWGVKIEYLKEDSPLGTAGAIRLLNPRPESSFLVTNGDVLSDIRYGDLLDFHCRNKAEATMAVRLHEWQHPFGVVRIQGVNIVGFEEKPVSRSHINAGVYALEPSALELIDDNERCDMPALFERLFKKTRRTIVYPMHEPWLDVGRPDDYKQANGALLKSGVDKNDQ